jgi:hypothetical protein
MVPLAISHGGLADLRWFELIIHHGVFVNNIHDLTPSLSSLNKHKHPQQHNRTRKQQTSRTHERIDSELGPAIGIACAGRGWACER